MGIPTSANKLHPEVEWEYSVRVIWRMLRREPELKLRRFAPFHPLAYDLSRATEFSSGDIPENSGIPP